MSVVPARFEAERFSPRPRLRESITDVSYVEGLIPREYGQDAREVPGARDLLSAVEAAHVPWAIVTSGSRALVTGWVEVLKLSLPPHLVVAEDVQRGKPDPACYRLGRSKLGLPSDASVLVIEDSPAGIRAGKAAGCKVLGLATTHALDSIKEAGPDWIVEDLRSVRFRAWDETSRQVTLDIRNALQG